MIRRPPRSTLFPTRRSSDLTSDPRILASEHFTRIDAFGPMITVRDRKSTRLNSSHSQISYAVFCLKKKKKNYNTTSLDKQHTPLTTPANHHMKSETSNALII